MYSCMRKHTSACRNTRVHRSMQCIPAQTFWHMQVFEHVSIRAGIRRAGTFRAGIIDYPVARIKAPRHRLSMRNVAVRPASVCACGMTHAHSWATTAQVVAQESVCVIARGTLQHDLFRQNKQGTPCPSSPNFGNNATNTRGQSAACLMRKGPSSPHHTHIPRPHRAWLLSLSQSEVKTASETSICTCKVDRKKTRLGGFIDSTEITNS